EAGAGGRLDHPARLRLTRRTAPAVVPPAPHDGRRRVLLCEPYCSGSHRAWAEGLARHSRHDVRLVTHRGAFWTWRMQGAALTLAAEVDRVVAGWGRPDVLLVSDMVHVPALLGLARRSLAGMPVVVYMHENQLTYPVPPRTAPDLTYAMVNWLSMAAADRVVFKTPSTTAASCWRRCRASCAGSPTTAT